MARGRETKGRKKKSAPGDLDNDTPGLSQAPGLSVLAAVALEHVSTTPTPVSTTPCPADSLTFSQITAVGAYSFLWVVVHTLQIGATTLWLDDFALPWSLGAAQLIIGSTVAVGLWIFKLRSTPGLTTANIKIIAPIAVCHTFSHVCAAVGIGGNGTHGFFGSLFIILNTEPLFAALFSAIFLEQALPVLALVTLVPACCAIVRSALDDPPDDWPTIGGGIGFNLAASLGAVLSTRAMGMDMGKNMSPAHLCAVVTIMTSAMFVPLAIIVEGAEIKDLWAAGSDVLEDDGVVAFFGAVVSGVCFVLLSEVAFRCLGLAHPMTHAVGSLFKNIFSTVFYEGERWVSKAVHLAVAGVLLYTLAKKTEPRQLAR